LEQSRRVLFAHVNFDVVGKEICVAGCEELLLRHAVNTQVLLQYVINPNPSLGARNTSARENCQSLSNGAMDKGLRENVRRVVIPQNRIEEPHIGISIQGWQLRNRVWLLPATEECQKPGNHDELSHATSPNAQRGCAGQWRSRAKRTLSRRWLTRLIRQFELRLHGFFR
jgi:hypothetical protein